jgi:hypothetical protein
MKSKPACSTSCRVLVVSVVHVSPSPTVWNIPCPTRRKCQEETGLSAHASVPPSRSSREHVGVAKGASRIGISHIDRENTNSIRKLICAVCWGPSRSRDDDTNATTTDRAQNRIRDNAINGVKIQGPWASVGRANLPPIKVSPRIKIGYFAATHNMNSIFPIFSLNPCVFQAKAGRYG